jgi:hypothetical protein
MKVSRLNWQLWAGFLLSVFTLLSYEFIFVRFPVTRDFPWANLLLFAIAAVLVVLGVRRGFAADRPRPTLSKVAASILASLSVVIIGLFLFAMFVASRWMPAAQGAPKVGQKAPEFSLADTSGRPVSLSELLSAPVQSVPPAVAGGSPVQPSGALARNQQEARAPKGVLLIFYRGYW